MKCLSVRQIFFLLEAFLELDKYSPGFLSPEKATMSIAQKTRANIFAHIEMRGVFIRQIY